MKALRIVLTQVKAHYRKEESSINKMTYPLPPFATVIGAVHNACSFKGYHPMDLSIQGMYEAITKQAYTDYCFLDSVMDDRGMLVKLSNGDLQSSSFKRVASALKSQGNSFRKGITIQVHNENLMNEYRELKDLNDEIGSFKKNRVKKFKEICKKRKKTLSDKKKKLDKKSEEFKFLTSREKEIKSLEKLVNEKLKEFIARNYEREISKYQSLTTSLRYYEILNNVKLIIHIKVSDEDLIKWKENQDNKSLTVENCLELLKENIYNLKSIGRSEDFVDIKECEIVEVEEEIEDEVKSTYFAYLNLDDIKADKIFLQNTEVKIPAKGTKYYLNKDYSLENGKRVFNKKKVLLTSNYVVEEIDENVYYDGKYIVNFN